MRSVYSETICLLFVFPQLSVISIYHSCAQQLLNFLIDSKIELNFGTNAHEIKANVIVNIDLYVVTDFIRLKRNQMESNGYNFVRYAKESARWQI